MPSSKKPSGSQKKGSKKKLKKKAQEKRKREEKQKQIIKKIETIHKAYPDVVTELIDSANAHVQSSTEIIQPNIESVKQFKEILVSLQEKFTSTEDVITAGTVTKKYFKKNFGLPDLENDNPDHLSNSTIQTEDRSAPLSLIRQIEREPSIHTLMDATADSSIQSVIDPRKLIESSSNNFPSTSKPRKDLNPQEVAAMKEVQSLLGELHSVSTYRDSDESIPETTKDDQNKTVSGEISIVINFGSRTSSTANVSLDCYINDSNINSNIKNERHSVTFNNTLTVYRTETPRRRKCCTIS